MTLASYVKQLMSRISLGINAVADAAGVAGGTLHNIMRGKTEHPTPDVLERLARYFGEAEGDQRRIYQDLMTLAGYLDFLPLPLNPTGPTSSESHDITVGEVHEEGS
ncbi:MAG: helix-turn-helix domain-containing protein [Ardenticatenales bacterium]|nr:helix-turn-helix domain-containing protein [Ardenticatenales bacterium]